MVYEEELKNRRCPRCGSVESQVNAGFDRSGSQRCICRKCNYNYTLNPKYSEEIKQQAIRLYKSGKSGREVGKILNVNKATVLHWVKKLDNNAK